MPLYVPGSACWCTSQEARNRQDRILLEHFHGRSLAIARGGLQGGLSRLHARTRPSVNHGFEISPAIARIARERLEREGLTNAEIFVGDESEAKLPPHLYDVVLCLYLTPGSFREPSENLASYTNAYLDRNPGHQRVLDVLRSPEGRRADAPHDLQGRSRSGGFPVRREGLCFLERYLERTR